MIKLENQEVIGLEHAIRGMRNPMNSWDKSDSKYKYMCTDLNDDEEPHFCENCNYDACNPYINDPIYVIGENDLSLMKKLAKAGTDHRKFMRMILIYVDITAPLYWWKEYDTYKVGTVANSCSTMHKIQEKEFTLDDFSCEHLDLLKVCPSYDVNFLNPLEETIKYLNWARNKFLATKDKKYWWQMIQLLPSSYNQKRTVMLNYEVLANIYKSRKNHKLDEWRNLCNWIEQLPYSELIIGDVE